MADSVTSNDLDKRVKKIKRDLEGWREVLIPLNSVLLWEKNWYPGMLIGITTSIFMLFWYLDPSVLTTISVVGLLTTLVDYLVPTLTSSICHPDNWTGIKERQLEEICRSLASVQAQAAHCFGLVSDTRQSRPNIYYASVVLTLVALAWIGSATNNLLLAYLIVTSLILLPGMRRHNLLKLYFHHVVDKVQGCDKKNKKKN